MQGSYNIMFLGAKILMLIFEKVHWIQGSLDLYIAYHNGKM